MPGFPKEGLIPSTSVSIGDWKKSHEVNEEDARALPPSPRSAASALILTSFLVHWQGDAAGAKGSADPTGRNPLVEELASTVSDPVGKMLEANPVVWSDVQGAIVTSYKTYFDQKEATRFSEAGCVRTRRLVGRSRPIIRASCPTAKFRGRCQLLVGQENWTADEKRLEEILYDADHRGGQRPGRRIPTGNVS